MYAQIKPAEIGTKLIAKSIFGCIAAMTLLVSLGCEPSSNNSVPPGGNNVPAGGGTATAATGPIVRFTAPADSLVVEDDSYTAIQFSVDTASQATVGLFLDPDQDAGNGNEIHFAQGLVYQTGVTQGSVDLTAGFYPYGTYFVKARATDGNKMNYYSAPGLVNIVSSGGAIGSDEGLGDLAGLQLLYDSGKPRSIENRIPFVDTWYVVDMLDNLSPKLVVPIELTEPTEIHRLQFYVFGMDAPRDKRVEIYQGTDENSVGEKIRTIDLPGFESRRNGWWNMVTPAEPIVLPAGKYGFSYHAAFEFSEHWAGHAPIGPGYMWFSLVEGAPFNKGTEAEMGFVPNFGIRLIGKFTGKNAGGAPRAKLPDRRAEEAVIAADQAKLPPKGVDPQQYGYHGDERELHVVWRHAQGVNR